MSVALPADFENYIQQAVATGQYPTTEEAVQEAFRLLKDRDCRTQSLRQDLVAGYEQLQRGEGVEYDDAGLDALFGDIERRHAERTSEKRSSQS